MTDLAAVESVAHPPGATKGMGADASISPDVYVRAQAIGDCRTPDVIAGAVCAAHRLGRDLMSDLPDQTSFQRENIALAGT